MFTNFSDAARKVHFPDDRRWFIGIKPSALYILGFLLLATVGAAWIEYLFLGLPKDPSADLVINAADPKGFPWWLSLSHWVNFFFWVTIIRNP